MMDWGVLIADEKYLSAYECLKKVIIKEKSADVLYNLALCCYKLSKGEEGEEYAISALELNPDIDKLYLIIAIKFQLRKYDEVIYFSKQYLNFDPSNLSILEMLGDSYISSKDLDKALQVLLEIKKIDTRSSVDIDRKIEQIQMELHQRKEKERLENWAEQFYSYSKFGEKGRCNTNLSFGSLFRDQILEYKLIEKLMENGKGQLHDIKILDIGCGEGRWLRKFIDWGAEPQNLTGIDLNPEIIELAKRLAASEINFEVAHADKLSYKDKSFDVVIAIGVLQHILDSDLQKAVGKEILRVLKDDGIIITYNFNEAGWAITAAKTKNRVAAMGIEEKNLNWYFSSCSIQYEKAFLSDSMIYNLLPEKWGQLYDLAIEPYSINHALSIAVIKKHL